MGIIQCFARFVKVRLNVQAARQEGSRRYKKALKRFKAAPGCKARRIRLQERDAVHLFEHIEA
jgi:hypothetical protein